MTAKKILLKKAANHDDGFTSGQIKWIIEAMEEYAALSKVDMEMHLELLLMDIDDNVDNLNPVKHSNSYRKLKNMI